jgi:hypothetical protein
MVFNLTHSQNILRYKENGRWSEPYYSNHGWPNQNLYSLQKSYTHKWFKKWGDRGQFILKKPLIKNGIFIQSRSSQFWIEGEALWHKIGCCCLKRLNLNIWICTTALWRQLIPIPDTVHGQMFESHCLKITIAFHNFVKKSWLKKQDWKSFQSLPASIILVYCIGSNLG